MVIRLQWDSRVYAHTYTHVGGTNAINDNIIVDSDNNIFVCQHQRKILTASRS